MDAKQHLSLLLDMASHHDLSIESRKGYLYDLGASKGLSEEAVDQLIEKSETLPDFSSLSESDQLECLYTAIQFMKKDADICPKDLNNCQEMTTQMDYSPQPVTEPFNDPYSDPSLTMNHYFLSEIATTYSFHEIYG